MDKIGGDSKQSYELNFKWSYFLIPWVHADQQVIFYHEIWLKLSCLNIIPFQIYLYLIELF